MQLLMHEKMLFTCMKVLKAGHPLINRESKNDLDQFP